MSTGMETASQAFGWEIAGGAVSHRASHYPVVIVSALLFAASAAATVLWCTSMQAMPAMTMPGGWTMGMMWMRMPGGTWLGSAVSFVSMWTVMMVAMMLPALVPMLCRYRTVAATAGARQVGSLTSLVAVGYFLVWALVGVAVYPIGVTVAAIAMEQPAVSREVPFGAGVVVVLAAALQFTSWKARQLVCCRTLDRARVLPANVRTAWTCGLRLGLDCVRRCGNLMAILLVLGVMDLRVMAAVTVAMTLERLGAHPLHMRHRHRIRGVCDGRY